MSSVGALDTEWTLLAAGVLGIPPDEVERHAMTAPFLMLGGTSLRATEFAGLVERRLGRSVDMTALLGPEPLADVVAAAPPATPRAPLPRRSDTDASTRRPAAGQESMVLGEQIAPGTQFHLLFSAEITGPLDDDRWIGALATVTARHEALRTVFVSDRGELRVRVLDKWRPRLIRPELPPGVTTGVLESIHTLLVAASTSLLRPLEQPPVVFGLTRIDETHAIASILIHHAISDGWSIGLLWRDLIEAYDDGTFATPAGSPDLIVAAETSPLIPAAAEVRVRALADVPLQVEIPSDLRRPSMFDRRGVRLHFGLSDTARDGCDRIARACGVTRNAVLLGAWALVVGRSAGVSDILIGLSSAGRTSADLHGVFGLCTKLIPVRARAEATDTVRDYLSRLGAEFRASLTAGGVPLEVLGGRLRPPRDLRRTAVVQIGFAVHDELVPTSLAGRDLLLTLHEGHCGGTVFDALLFVQRWGADTRLALEYASSVLTPAEATTLAGQMETALCEMALDLEGPLGAVRTVSAAASRRLARDGAGAQVDAEAGLWQLFELACDSCPDAVALRDGLAGQPLSYAELRRAAVAQAEALRAAGVEAGDHVAIALTRGAVEIVSVLAILRLGAAYVGLDPAAPADVLAKIIEIAAPKAVLATPARGAELVELAPHLSAVALVDPFATHHVDPTHAAAARADPDRVAYVAFTSGSTGVPKGVRVPHRAVVRLVRDPSLLVPGATDRFLRLAPLAFDASTLEIFATLTSGGCLEIFATPQLTPDALARFMRERAVTGGWLTAGLFRLVAGDQPEAFAGLRQLLTGGEVVPPAQARQVLESCPGLRLTNGYGPTENTTFTTVFHADDAAAVTDPLPIGRPLAGTTVMVRDDQGRPLPPGAIGELCTSGDGLAVDYLGAPQETARSFVTAPDDSRYYRTGDLVRWNGDGDLMYVGRRDQQVKIRGFRVELAAVTQVLRDHHLVQDAVVVASGDPGDRQLVAGIVAASDERSQTDLHAYAAKRLPAYAVPVLWAFVDELPVNRNGKLDTASLVAMARANIGYVAN